LKVRCTSLEFGRRGHPFRAPNRASISESSSGLM
jgi:hypothetical protein